jgi:NADH:ubiquinone oxidoreductase subunit 2 (subunit N)
MKLIICKSGFMHTLLLLSSYDWKLLNTNKLGVFAGIFESTPVVAKLMSFCLISFGVGGST